ncbi:nucleosome assembly protein 1-like 1 [Ischnura elegans]|uniref:nucleosome assembly protein 1-like 1 n=1 Tax=Ischnura elegans TaxID=197161 RepID=UPI001ED873C1|nr:nucleosome assembly protein 1-like 1 [Ischnura elegans]XP_046394491.1 nucleosome assembly protein 1-like 1 [Ischnura elegans]XP_046394492.1 nucleosome assembly protein 1-like 1 [Ischnura elegans]
MADPERTANANENVEEMEDEEEEVEVGNNDYDDSKTDVLASLNFKALPMPQSYPPSVKRRIKALKRLQLESTKIEAKFYAEVHALECKYFKNHYQPLLDKRSKITSGDYEPNDEECEWSSDDEEKEEEKKIITEMNKVKIKEEEDSKENENQKNDNVKGIPDFWLTIFKTVGMLAEMVQEHDEPILKHLVDVKVQFSESNPMGFVLEFHFSPNEYFTNTVLTKEYEMTCVPDESDPFSFEGPEIYKCKGCTIDWKKGKNVTVKLVKKRQKHKSRGSLRTVTKTVQNDSFFNFFNPPTVPEDHEGEIDRDVQALLTNDFEIGHYIRERIVPHAVLYFTGEALDEEDYEDEEGDEEEDSCEDDDPDYTPSSKAANAAARNANPAECNQQ